MTQRRLGVAATTVLHAVSGGRCYGFDIIDATRLPSGAVYPALARLEELGFLRSRWEDARVAQVEKRPPRRYYETTAAGERALVDARGQHEALARLLRTAGLPRSRGKS